MPDVLCIIHCALVNVGAHQKTLALEDGCAELARDIKAVSSGLDHVRAVDQP